MNILQLRRRSSSSERVDRCTLLVVLQCVQERRAELWQRGATRCRLRLATTLFVVYWRSSQRSDLVLRTSTVNLQSAWKKYTCFKESSCLLKTSKSIISKCDIFKFINFQEQSFSCQNEWWIIANFLEKVTTSLPWSDPSDSSCYSQNGMPSGGSGWRQSGQIRHHSTINPKSFHRGNYTCPPQSSKFFGGSVLVIFFVNRFYMRC